MKEAIIIDDELHCVETLEEKIKLYCPEIKIIAKFLKPMDGITFLQHHKIDIVFLDIEMPVYNGFSLLEKLGKIDFHLIFTTAFDQYALKAIKFSAFDYLLKPINRNDLEAINEKLNATANKNLLDEQYKILLQQLSNNQTQNTKISISSHEGMHFIWLKDLVRIESDNNYCTFIFTNQKSILVSRTLKEFEELLTPHRFFRIHNSHIINISFISKFLKADGGYVIMENGDKIEISRRRKEAFNEFLNQNKMVEK